MDDADLQWHYLATESLSGMVSDEFSNGASPDAADLQKYVVEQHIKAFKESKLFSLTEKLAKLGERIKQAVENKEITAKQDAGYSELIEEQGAEYREKIEKHRQRYQLRGHILLSDSLLTSRVLSPPNPYWFGCR